MSDATAQLKNYRQSPRKVRLVADLVRGKTVEGALAMLANLPKRASEPMQKLIRSAAANSNGIPMRDLIIEKIEVGSGIVFKRMMPRARGRASAIRKKASHVKISLAKKRTPATSAKAK
jgi:large subunit ribosomal protein L22